MKAKIAREKSNTTQEESQNCSRETAFSIRVKNQKSGEKNAKKAERVGDKANFSPREA